MGTSWCDFRRNLPRIFKVPPAARGRRENCGVLRLAMTHSPCERIPGPRRLMQKRKLFPELQWASPSRVALPRRIRGSERFRYQVLEYGPDSLSAMFDNSRNVDTIEID